MTDLEFELEMNDMERSVTCRMVLIDGVSSTLMIQSGEFSVTEENKK